MTNDSSWRPFWPASQNLALPVRVIIWQGFRNFCVAINLSPGAGGVDGGPRHGPVPRQGPHQLGGVQAPHIYKHPTTISNPLFMHSFLEVFCSTSNQKHSPHLWAIFLADPSTPVYNRLLIKFRRVPSFLPSLSLPADLLPLGLFYIPRKSLRIAH